LERAAANGGNAANAVAVRSENTEAPDWGTATETSAYADSQTHELSGTAEIEATRNDLDDDAAELLAASLDPVTFSVTLHPDWLADYLDLLPGDWCPTNVKAGSLSIIGTYRIVGWELGADDLLRFEMGNREAPT